MSSPLWGESITTFSSEKMNQVQLIKHFNNCELGLIILVLPLLFHDLPGKFDQVSGNVLFFKLFLYWMIFSVLVQCVCLGVGDCEEVLV